MVFRLVLIGLALVLAACNLNNPAGETPSSTPTEAEASPTFTLTLDSAPLDTFSPTPLIQLTDVATPIPGTPRSAPTLPGIAPVGVRPEDVTAAPTIPANTTATPEIVFPQNFPDRYEVDVNTGQTLVVNYEVVINNPGRGRVFIVVRDPAGQDIWRLVVTETTTESADVPTSTGGTHEILVAVENLSGRYSVTFARR